MAKKERVKSITSGKSYIVASKEDLDMMKHVADKYRKELAKVKISLVFMQHAEEGGPALTKNGDPVETLTKVNDTKARAQGLADATIFIDKRIWDRCDDLNKEAMLHSALMLEVQKRENGDPTLDAVGRPKLTHTPADFKVEGYMEVAKAHGADYSAMHDLSDAAERFHKHFPKRKPETD